MGAQSGEWRKSTKRQSSSLPGVNIKKLDDLVATEVLKEICNVKQKSD
jgi:hypothetical protein